MTDRQLQDTIEQAYARRDAVGAHAPPAVPSERDAIQALLGRIVADLYDPRSSRESNMRRIMAHLGSLGQQLTMVSQSHLLGCAPWPGYPADVGSGRFERNGR